MLDKKPEVSEFYMWPKDDPTLDRIKQELVYSFRLVQVVLTERTGFRVRLMDTMEEDPRLYLYGEVMHTPIEPYYQIRKATQQDLDIGLKTAEDLLRTKWDEAERTAKIARRAYNDVGALRERFSTHVFA